MSDDQNEIIENQPSREDLIEKLTEDMIQKLETTENKDVVLAREVADVKMVLRNRLGIHENEQVGRDAEKAGSNFIEIVDNIKPRVKAKKYDTYAY